MPNIYTFRNNEIFRPDEKLLWNIMMKMDELIQQRGKEIQLLEELVMLHKLAPVPENTGRKKQTQPPAPPPLMTAEQLQAGQKQ